MTDLSRAGLERALMLTQRTELQLRKDLAAAEAALGGIKAQCVLQVNENEVTLARAEAAEARAEEAERALRDALAAVLRHQNPDSADHECHWKSKALDWNQKNRDLVARYENPDSAQPITPKWCSLVTHGPFCDPLAWHEGSTVRTSAVPMHPDSVKYESHRPEDCHVVCCGRADCLCYAKAYLAKGESE